MPILLDTSVAIALREGQEPVLQRAERLSTIALLSILSVVELEGGVPLAPEGAQARRLLLDELYATMEILVFGEEEAGVYRSIVTALGFSRQTVIDRLIAAQAIAAGATLATLNPKDFLGLPNLTVEDWTR